MNKRVEDELYKLAEVYAEDCIHFEWVQVISELSELLANVSKFYMNELIVKPLDVVLLEKIFDEMGDTKQTIRAIEKVYGLDRDYINKLTYKKHVARGNIKE